MIWVTWLTLPALVIGLYWLLTRQQAKRRLPLRTRSEKEEALRVALADWLNVPEVRQALVKEGFDRSEFAIARCVGDLGKLSYTGVRQLAERVLEHRRVRHLIARRVMALSGVSQHEVKVALRQLGGIET